MARFRVWDERVRQWRDCVDVPMYVLYNDDWLALLPNSFSVANQFGDRWHEIDDSPDPDFDDPCATIDSEGCNGSPTSKTRGSGDGKGSRGPVYDQLKGYPPGYDLPDAGRSGFGQILNGAAPTGRAINRPGIHLQESYDPVGVTTRYGLGTYANPNTPFSYVSGRGARITETIYAIPNAPGIVEIPFVCYDTYGMSIDIYHMGLRVASTCGKVTGRGRISFEYDRAAQDRRIMIRVRCEPSAAWALTVLPPSLITTVDRANLPLEYQTAYDFIQYPDLISERFLGTTVFPAPCHATVFPRKDRIVDNAALEYWHYIGAVQGRIILDYTSWDNFDYIEIYHNGRRIATTLDPQTELGYLTIEYNGTTDVTDIMVRIVASDFKGGASLESNYYSLYCPEARGARTYRHPCETYVIMSAGHHVTEDNFALGTQVDKRAVLVNCRAGSYESTFEVFDNKMNLLDREVVPAHSQGTLEFWKETWHVDRADITIRVTSAIGSDWSYFVWCPIQPAKLEHRDLLLTYNCLTVEDQQQIWSIKQETNMYYNFRMDHEVQLNYQVATDRGESWHGGGRNPEIQAGAASVGGQFYKSKESMHGDMWCETIQYNPVKKKFGNFEIDRVEVSLWNQGDTGAWIEQTPNAANGWMCAVRVNEHRPGEHWVQGRITMTTYYKIV